jgi:DNA-binding response OmpR family regulator
VCHPDVAFVAEIRWQLQRLGWEVQIAASGPEARRLARLISPAVVLLGAEGRQESGWLTCAKLCRELPEQPVVLVADDPERWQRRFATFVGAVRLVGRKQGWHALLEAVTEPCAASS